MPRRKLANEKPRSTDRNLVIRLAEELKSNRKIGQPVIYEQEFPGERIRATVIWDEWDRLELEERTSVILRAYVEAEGTKYRNRIVLASGLTIPEAEAAGMLPFQIIIGLRKEDPVTQEECQRAMIEVGGSTLLDPQNPQLRFATLEEANAARNELIGRLPMSEEVWVIIHNP